MFGNLSLNPRVAWNTENKKKKIIKNKTMIDQTKLRDNVAGKHIFISMIDFLIPGISDRHSVGRSP